MKRRGTRRPFGWVGVPPSSSAARREVPAFAPYAPPRGLPEGPASTAVPDHLPTQGSGSVPGCPPPHTGRGVPGFPPQPCPCRWWRAPSAEAPHSSRRPAWPPPPPPSPPPPSSIGRGQGVLRLLPQCHRDALVLPHLPPAHQFHLLNSLVLQGIPVQEVAVSVRHRFQIAGLLCWWWLGWSFSPKES